MSLNKEDIIKLSAIISDYANPEKSKREQSEIQLKELRNKNLGMLSLGLLEISASNEFSETIKLTYSSKIKILREVA